MTAGVKQATLWLLRQFDQHPRHGHGYGQPSPNLPEFIDSHPDQENNEIAFKLGIHPLGNDFGHLKILGDIARRERDDGQGALCQQCSPDERSVSGLVGGTRLSQALVRTTSYMLSLTAVWRKRYPGGSALRGLRGCVSVIARSEAMKQSGLAVGSGLLTWGC